MRLFTLLTALFFAAAFSLSAQEVVFEEGFEGAGLPDGWTQEYIDGLADWDCDYSGGYYGNPSGAHGGSENAMLYSGFATTVLITSAIDFGDYANLPTLTFWHAQKTWGGDQDELNVYYRVGESGAWQLLASYNEDTPDWTQRTVILPEAGGDIYIAFEGLARYGYGVCIDDISVTGLSEMTYPVVIAPTGGEEVTAYPVEFSWIGSEDADSYTLQISDDPAFGTVLVEESGIVGVSYDYEGDALDDYNTYYWRVQWLEDGAPSDWSALGEFYFNTQFLCDFSCGDPDLIDMFYLGEINYTNTTVWEGYINSGLSSVVVAGQAAEFEASYGLWGRSHYNSYFRIFADWDGDGYFDGDEEMLYSNGMSRNTYTVDEILVPEWVPEGNYTMRVMASEYNGTPLETGCGSLSYYANAVDFQINVLNLNPPAVESPTYDECMVSKGDIFSWSADREYDYYEIQFSRYEDFSYISKTLEVSELTYEICEETALDPIGGYYFRVAGVYMGYYSNWSEAVKFNTSPAFGPLTLVLTDDYVCEGADADLGTYYECGGELYSITAIGGSGDADNYYFLWSPYRYLENHRSAHPIYEVNQTMRFRVIVIDPVSRERQMSYKYVYAAEGPQISFSPQYVTVEPIELVNLGDYLSVSGGTPPYEYEWSDGRKWTSSEANPALEMKRTTRFYLQVTDAEGCVSDVDYFMVNVDYSKQAQFAATGDAALSVYPNPASNVVNVRAEFGEISNVELKLSNALGQSVFVKSVSGSSISETVDVSNLTPGLYLLETAINGEKSVSKIVVE